MSEEVGTNEVAPSIENDKVVTAYKTASEVANNVLTKLIAETTPGKKVFDLCAWADGEIEKAMAPLFSNKPEITKGVAFPTCISVNNTVGGYSPADVETSVVIAEGDLVKVDLAVHLDGYSTAIAHSFVVGGGEVTGRKADVIAAAHTAAEAALRLFRPGHKNTEVTQVFEKVAEAFGVHSVEGVLSHNVTKGVIDGKKVIISKHDPEHKVEEFEFALNEVYHLDVVMSTGEGKPKERFERTTVYKRGDEAYQLKMKSSRALLLDVTRKFGKFPFTMRAITDRSARLGLTECIKHELLHPYPVLFEKQGEFVAQFKYTVFIQNNGVVRVTGIPLSNVLKSDHVVADESIKALLTAPLKPKKNKAKNDEASTSKPMDTK